MTKYVKDYRGWVGILHEKTEKENYDWIQYTTTSCTVNKEELALCKPATKEEIEKYNKDVADIKRREKEREDRDNAILAKIKLTQNDFCRFRDVHEEKNGTIVVCTRENGVGGVSVGAVRSEYYCTRCNDLGDSTYAYYFFRVDKDVDKASQTKDGYEW